MPKKNLREAVQQSWYHAHEEDTATEKVYRRVPANNAIPPGRGRELLTLRPDGTLVRGGIAPNDARTEADGTWAIEDDTLALRFDETRESPRVLEIQSVDEERLVVKK